MPKCSPKRRAQAANVGFRIDWNEFCYGSLLGKSPTGPVKARKSCGRGARSLNSRAVTRFIDSDLAACLDRLPFSRWHWLVVTALGIPWMLDGVEVTIVGALGSVLQEPGTLGLSAGQVGLSGTVYIAGAISGALFCLLLRFRCRELRLPDRQ
jgi:hypothetical protein